MVVARLSAPLIAFALVSYALPAPAVAPAPPPALRENPLPPDLIAKSSRSRVTGVTVFPDRARTTRTQRVAVSAGPREVEFADLPAGLDAASVRASGSGSAKAGITGLDVRMVQLGAPAEARTRDLEGRIRALEDREKDLGAELESLRGMQHFLRTTLIASGPALGQALASRSFDPKEWLGALNVAEPQDLRLSKAILKAQRSGREAAEQRDVLRRDLAALRGFRARQAREVRVFLDVARAGDLDLAVTYDVPGASWVPAYDLVLEPDLARVRLSYQAQVTQQTGEDWPDVKVVLSSGRPDLGAAPPEPEAWVLDVTPPLRAGRRDRAGAGAPAAAKAASAERARPAEADESKDEEAAEPVGIVEAAMHSQGTAVQFEAYMPATLPGDGRPHHVPIGDRVVPATASYRVVPRLSPHAYLTAELGNTTPWPLLPGTVRAHIGDDFVGTTPLPDDIAPGATWSVAFGADRQIKVSRTVLKRLTGERGFIINKRRRAEYGFKIALQNQKAVPVTLRVTEPIPVSRREDIAVRVSGDARMPGPADPPGFLTWTVDLPAGGRREIVWGYDIEWPQEMAISGLE